MSVGSMGSQSSFIKRLGDTVKEGEEDVKKGKVLFGAKKNRAIDEANKPSEKGEKLQFANKNDPILVLNELPLPTRDALMAMSAESGHACLLQYLDRHTNMLKNELSKAAVREQKTLCDKFEKLKGFMYTQKIQFEPQTDFY